jgi:hypothetical protein
MVFTIYDMGLERWFLFRVSGSYRAWVRYHYPIAFRLLRYASGFLSLTLRLLLSDSNGRLKRAESMCSIVASEAGESLVKQKAPSMSRKWFSSENPPITPCPDS